AEIEEVPAGDDVAIRVIERTNGTEERGALLRCLGLRLRRWGRIAGAQTFGPAIGELRAPAVRAALIARRVGNDAEQPGTPRRSGTETPQGAVGREEAVLRGVFSVCRRPRDQVRGAKRDVGVALHQFRICLLVAASSAGYELCLVQWWPSTERSRPSLHRRCGVGSRGVAVRRPARRERGSRRA